jgi:hypothetical protein
MTAIKSDIRKCRKAIARKRGEIQEAESACRLPIGPGTYCSPAFYVRRDVWRGYLWRDYLWRDLDSLYQNLDRLYLELGNAQDRREAARTRTQGTVGGGNADPTWGAHQNLVHSNPNSSTLHTLTSSLICRSHLSVDIQTSADITGPSTTEASHFSLAARSRSWYLQGLELSVSFRALSYLSARQIFATQFQDTCSLSSSISFRFSIISLLHRTSKLSDHLQFLNSGKSER